MSSPANSALADLPAEQILDMAVSNWKTAPAYTLTGRLFQKPGPVDATVRVLRGTGYERTFRGTGFGTVTILDVGGTAWLKPDAEYIHVHTLLRGGPNFAVLAGKYVRCTDASIFGDPDGIAGLTCLANPAPGSVTRDSPEIRDREGVIPLLSVSGDTAAYVTVTDTATPQIIEASISRCRPVCSFDITYGTPDTLTAPPDDQTVDGKLYGF